MHYTIIGSGLAGLTLAHKLQEKGHSVIVYERRNKPGGNCTDTLKHGQYVHDCGPHIFHTSNQNVVEFLSRFTGWVPYKHIVKAYVNDRLMPFPVNYGTLKFLYGNAQQLIDVLGREFYQKGEVSIFELEKSNNLLLRELGRNLYAKFYAGYTAKQWGEYSDKIDTEVIKRSPIRLTFDNSFFTDSFQALPIDGYSEMFANMAKGIDIEYSTNGPKDKTNVILTGRVDEYFNFKYGKLPYRGVKFEEKTYSRCWGLKAPVVNYPDDRLITRETDYSWIGSNNTDVSVVVSETPGDGQDEPFYPIPCEETAKQFALYKNEADLQGVRLCGRLAEYKYMNMDKVIESAFALAEVL